MYFAIVRRCHHVVNYFPGFLLRGAFDICDPKNYVSTVMTFKLVLAPFFTDCY